MKKIILIATILLINVTSNAQELSYGILFGTNAYESANNNGTAVFVASSGNFALNFGGYVEYNFNTNLGLKVETGFNKKAVSFVNSNYDFKMTIFEVAPSLKLDFGKEYRKGFYMLAGPKFSTMTSATYDGVDAIDTFNKTRTGLQLGFGTRIKKIIDFETKLDYEFTPFFEATNDRKSNFFNVYFTLGLDVERLINNK